MNEKNNHKEPLLIKEENVNAQNELSKNPIVIQLNQKNEEALKKLYVVSIVCFIFMIIEFIGGYMARSIAIMSDAAHLLSDFLGFVISIVSIYISRQEASKHMSYGYHRAEVIGALVSVNLIWGLTIWLFYEATLRILNPEPVNGGIMVITGGLGLVFNVIMGLVLMKFGIDHTLHSHDHDDGHDHGHGHSHPHHHEKKGKNYNSFSSREGKGKKIRENKNSKHAHEHHHDQEHNDNHDHEHHNDHDHDHDHEHHHDHKHDHGHSHGHSHGNGHNHGGENVNVRAALIHIIGDLIQNVGVVIAALIIYFFPSMVIFDPICTYVFSIIVLFTTFRIVKDCIKILMEGSPDIDIDELTEDLLKLKGVVEVHDIHIWSLSMGKVSFSCHIISETPQVTLKKARKMLLKKYLIQHATIQVEANQERIDTACQHDLH